MSWATYGDLGFQTVIASVNQVESLEPLEIIGARGHSSDSDPVAP